MTILAVANHKGGSTKTTTTATLAVALAEQNKRVLACDLDSQASLTATFGLESSEIEQQRKTLYHALLDEDTSIGDVTVGMRERVDLVPSSRNLAAGEVLLLHDEDGDLSLHHALASVRTVYDYILLDCPPSLGKLTINALAAADYVIIPVTCSFLTVKALGQLLDTIEQVKTKLNPLLRIMGILLTRSTHTLHAAEVEKRVRDIFTDQVFTTVIGQSVRFEEAPAAGQTILDYETSHPGAQAYRTFAKEVLRYEETHRSP